MTLTFLALYLGGALLILFVGGRLLRTDICRAVAESRGTSYPRSRLLEDLRPVQATMMEFIAESPRSREIMQVFASSEGRFPSADCGAAHLRLRLAGPRSSSWVSPAWLKLEAAASS